MIDTTTESVNHESKYLVKTVIYYDAINVRQLWIYHEHEMDFINTWKDMKLIWSLKIILTDKTCTP